MAVLQNEFGKTNYSSEDEESLRYQIFLSNVAYINATNSRNVTSQLAINQFADLTFQEFKSLYLGFVPAPKDQLPNATGTFTASSVGRNLPAHYDWRDHGAVTPVKNQGQCGSCWAFSATGALEGQYAIKYGVQALSLSEQNLMDCSWSYGNQGCGGGLSTNAFRYVAAQPGIDTESSYPYTGRNRHSCLFSNGVVGAYCSGYNSVASTETDLQVAVANVGPISVAIDATRNFQFWKPSDGVFYDSTCSSNYYKLNHEVLVVGYGTDSSGQAYWIVKNSWGSGWGAGGYIKMARNRNNMCGIATDANYPTGVSNQRPPRVLGNTPAPTSTLPCSSGTVVSFNTFLLFLLATKLFFI